MRLLQLAMLVNLVAFSLVASQPLFYGVALTSVTEALPAPAYVELRNQVNAVMKRRLPALYLFTIASCAAVLALALVARERWVALTAAVALAALVVDVGFMVGVNVPINTAIESWTATDYPADWQSYRARWSHAFTFRQVATVSGFLSLLVGAIFRP